MRSIELFAGAGGLALGLEQAGFEHIGLIELDHAAADTLKKNRPFWNVLCEDISNVASRDVENEFGIKMNRKKIQRIMRKYNIVCPIRKANPYKRMAKATQEHRVVENKLNREFKQNIPGKVLLTDITYMPYGNNKMAYLSTVKDSSTNEILAYNLSNSLAIELVTETVDKLVSTESFKLHKDAFIHSDQGVHYTSPRFQNLLKQNNLGQSMSRKGNCWDNAPQESFFGHMKDEIDYKSCNEFEELQIMVDDYMDYYNNFRCQWNLKKLTPVQFRNQLLMAA